MYVTHRITPIYLPYVSSVIKVDSGSETVNKNAAPNNSTSTGSICSRKAFHAQRSFETESK